MSKQKKVTVKPYLHITDEPVGTAHHEDGSKHPMYPLYYLITYNRKNQKLKSYYSMPLDERDMADKKTAELIEFESTLFEKIIRLEADPETAEYDMKGLKQRFAVYAVAVRITFSAYLKEKLKFAIMHTNNKLMSVLDYEDSKVDFLTLLEAAHLLFPNLTKFIKAAFKAEIEAFKAYDKVFPNPVFTYTFGTLLDWKQGSHKQELEEGLKNLSKTKRAKIIGIVDHVVEEGLKELRKP